MMTGESLVGILESPRKSGMVLDAAWSSELNKSLDLYLEILDGKVSEKRYQLLAKLCDNEFDGDLYRMQV